MEMVNMYTDVVDVMHVTPAWLLLSPAATRFVREHERPYPHRSHHIWRCNHCAQHFEKQGMQQEVLDHVKWVYVSISFIELFISSNFVIQPLYRESSDWRRCRSRYEKKHSQTSTVPLVS